MTRYYAIDIGTNSCRLLIADREGDSLRPVFGALNSTRIGEGLYLNYELTPVAMERTLNCLREYGSTLREYRAHTGRAFATSAVREARNGTEFLRRCRDEAGLAVELISGEEEAALSYAGASRRLKLAAPMLLVDLGGGSTEFICPPQALLLSLPLGAVRAHEQNLERAAIAAALKPLSPCREALSPHPLVFAGGSASTLAAVDLRLAEFKTELVHGHALSLEKMRALYHHLSGLPLAERRQLPGLQPERADIIVHGALIALTIMEELRRDHCTISESDLLHGAILTLKP
ncbi:MAG: Ppx/GppA family phosphatase [Syntrophomonadaceae bacterium]|nr:Ppx/GppA family phosphatase [Syntrophomonadaceae bacterium]